jgi:TubC N-terminal docking domain
MSKPLELFYDFSARGVKVWAESGKLKFKTDNGKLSPADRELLQAHKAELLRILAPGLCPKCGSPLQSSGSYHFWCEAGHYDQQWGVPMESRANYCRFHHDPLTDGQCARCDEVSK